MDWQLASVILASIGVGVTFLVLSTIGALIVRRFGYVDPGYEAYRQKSEEPHGASDQSHAHDDQTHSQTTLQFDSPDALQMLKDPVIGPAIQLYKDVAAEFDRVISQQGRAKADGVRFFGTYAAFAPQVGNTLPPATGSYAAMELYLKAHETHLALATTREELFRKLLSHGSVAVSPTVDPSKLSHKMSRYLLGHAFANVRAGARRETKERFIRAMSSASEALAQEASTKAKEDQLRVLSVALNDIEARIAALQTALPNSANSTSIGSVAVNQRTALMQQDVLVPRMSSPTKS